MHYQVRNVIRLYQAYDKIFPLGPVSVWNNNKELLPNAVINVFRNFFEDNLPFLSLRCFSVSGNGLLYWKTTNVSALPSVLSADDEIENLTIVSNDHDITINYAAINDLKTGYYSCVSEISKIEFSVSTTLGLFCIIRPNLNQCINDF